MDTDSLVQRLLQGGKTQKVIDKAFDDGRLIKASFIRLGRAEYSYLCSVDMEVPVVLYNRILLPFCESEKEARDFSIDHILPEFDMDKNSDYWTVEKIDVFEDLTLPT